MTERRIMVIGAGPAGLVAALAARRFGLDVRVVEQAEDFRRVGGGLMIHPNGLRVLQSLDLLDSFRPSMRLTDRGRLTTIDGRTLSVSNLSELGGPLDLTAVVMRHRLQEHLLDAAIRAGVDVRFGKRLTSLEAIDRGVVLRFGKGDEETADVVTAADGVHSVARSALGMPAREVVVGEAYLRIVSDVPTESSEFREIWADDGRRFGICPLVDGKTYCFCTAPLGKWGETLAGGLSDWIASWSDFGPDVIRLLEGVADWTRVNYSELREIRMPRWHRPPVFLVGDAAHAMTPNLGQGANSAMVDSFVLMRLLADGKREPLDRVARRHESARLRFVTRLQSVSRGTGLMARPMSRPARMVRNTMLRLSGKIPPVRRSFLRTFAGENPREAEFFSR